MNLLSNLKAGANFAPALLIVLYYLFAALDLFSTHLASPDLRYEGNWIVLLFKLNWGQFIILYSIIVLFVTLGLLVALNYLHSYYKTDTQHSKVLILEVFCNMKLFISFIILGSFYSHVINIAHILINNYFAYIYIFRIENIFSSLSTRYISNQSFFQLYIQIVPLIMGYIFAVFKVKKIRSLYHSILTHSSQI